MAKKKIYKTLLEDAFELIDKYADELSIPIEEAFNHLYNAYKSKLDVESKIKKYKEVLEEWQSIVDEHPSKDAQREKELLSLRLKDYITDAYDYEGQYDTKIKQVIELFRQLNDEKNTDGVFDKNTSELIETVSVLKHENCCLKDEINKLHKQLTKLKSEQEQKTMQIIQKNIYELIKSVQKDIEE